MRMTKWLHQFHLVGIQSFLCGQCSAVLFRGCERLRKAPHHTCRKRWRISRFQVWACAWKAEPQCLLMEGGLCLQTELVSERQLLFLPACWTSRVILCPLES